LRVFYLVQKLRHQLLGFVTSTPYYVHKHNRCTKPANDSTTITDAGSR